MKVFRGGDFFSKLVLSLSENCFFLKGRTLLHSERKKNAPLGNRFFPFGIDVLLNEGQNNSKELSPLNYL